jgi:hypothetical protein
LSSVDQPENRTEFADVCNTCLVSSGYSGNRLN